MQRSVVNMRTRLEMLQGVCIEYCCKSNCCNRKLRSWAPSINSLPVFLNTSLVWNILEKKLKCVFTLLFECKHYPVEAGPQVTTDTRPGLGSIRSSVTISNPAVEVKYGLNRGKNQTRTELLRALQREHIFFLAKICLFIKFFEPRTPVIKEHFTLFQRKKRKLASI